MGISDWSSDVCSSDLIGTILFIGLLLSGRELAAPWMIKFLFYALVAVTIWNVVAQGFASKGIAGWWMGQPWFQEGLEYLEAGRIADVVILIGFSILAYVTLRSEEHTSEIQSLMRI